MRNSSPNRRTLKHSQSNQFAGHQPNPTCYLNPIPIPIASSTQTQPHSNPQSTSSSIQSTYSFPHSQPQSRRSSRVSLNPDSFNHHSDDVEEEEDERKQMQRLWDARLKLGVPQRSLSNSYSKRNNHHQPHSQLEPSSSSFFHGEYSLKTSRSSSPAPMSSPELSLAKSRIHFHSHQEVEYSGSRRGTGLGGVTNGTTTQLKPSFYQHESSNRPSYSRIVSLPLPSALGLTTKSSKRDPFMGNFQSSNTVGWNDSISPLSLEYSPPVGFISNSHRPSLPRACTESALEDGLLLATAALNLHARKLTGEARELKSWNGNGKGSRLTVQERRAKKMKILTESISDNNGGREWISDNSLKKLQPPSTSNKSLIPHLSLLTSTCQKNSRSGSSTTNTTSDSDLTSSASSLPPLSISSSLSQDTTNSSNLNPSKDNLSYQEGSGSGSSRLRLALNELPKPPTNSDELDLESEAKKRANRKAILAWTSGWNEWEWNHEDSTSNSKGSGFFNRGREQVQIRDEHVIIDDEDEEENQFSSLPPSSIGLHFNNNIFSNTSQQKSQTQTQFSDPSSNNIDPSNFYRRQSEVQTTLTKSLSPYSVLMTSSLSDDGGSSSNLPNQTSIERHNGMMMGGRIENNSLGLGGFKQFSQLRLFDGFPSTSTSSSISNDGSKSKKKSIGIDQPTNSLLMLPTNSTPAWSCQNDWCCWEASSSSTSNVSSIKKKKK